MNGTHSITLASQSQVVILGPKTPRHLVTLPRWRQPSDAETTDVWSADDDARLKHAAAGTTPIGRELIQKALWRAERNQAARKSELSVGWRSLLIQSEIALLEQSSSGSGSDGSFIANNLWRLDYRSHPPSMEQFLTDPEFLGSLLKPSRSGGIWPAWFEILRNEFDRDSFLHNVVLTGAIGTGKTTVMAIVLLYRICLLLLMKRPAEMFEQGLGTTLYFAIISVTREAARQTAFAQALSLMAASPFFCEACGILPKCALSDGDLELAKAGDNETRTSLRLISGSRTQHLIGRNIIGIGFDEGNCRLEKDQDAQAFELYGAMRNRVISRLKTREGYLAGITIIASSARDESSMTEQVRREIEAAGTWDEQRVFQKAIYEVKPLPAQSLTTYFKVTYGLPQQEPALLPGTYDAAGEIAEGIQVLIAPEAKVALVPGIYREAFQRNCRQALQDICGIGCGGSGRLFPTMADVERCLEISKEEGVPRAWKQDEVSISTEDSSNIWDFLDHRSFLTKRGGQISPLRHPERMRYAHIDLATQSCAGIALCHLVGQQNVDGLIRNGQPFSDSRLIVEYDLILAIRPGKTKPINFEKIQKLFLWLKVKCGFNFGLVSADQYQSEMPLQMIEARGIPVGRLSIDKDKTAYRQWRTAFEEQRIRLAMNERLYREASQLIERDKKYDHPPNGTKDVTDAAAGAYLNAVNSSEARTMHARNEPGLHWTSPSSAGEDHCSPPIEIPLQPNAAARRSQQFEA